MPVRSLQTKSGVWWYSQAKDYSDTNFLKKPSTEPNDNQLILYDKTNQSVKTITVSEGDLLTINANSEVTVINIGSDGQILEVNSGVPVWSSHNYIDISGMSTGDILYYNGGWQLLTVGSDGDVLTLSSGIPTWQAPASTSPITSYGYLTERNTVSEIEIANFSRDLTDFDVLYVTAYLKSASSTYYGSLNVYDDTTQLTSITGSGTTYAERKSYIDISSLTGNHTIRFKLIGNEAHWEKEYCKNLRAELHGGMTEVT